MQGLLGVSQRSELGFPPGFQGAGDQPVLRLDLAEGPLGAVCLIPGTLDGCARSFKVRMAASVTVRMCGSGEGPAGVSRRGLGVRSGVVVVSLP